MDARDLADGTPAFAPSRVAGSRLWNHARPWPLHGTVACQCQRQCSHLCLRLLRTPLRDRVSWPWATIVWLAVHPNRNRHSLWIVDSTSHRGSNQPRTQRDARACRHAAGCHLQHCRLCVACPGDAMGLGGVAGLFHRDDHDTTKPATTGVGLLSRAARAGIQWICRNTAVWQFSLVSAAGVATWLDHQDGGLHGRIAIARPGHVRRGAVDTTNTTTEHTATGGNLTRENVMMPATVVAGLFAVASAAKMLRNLPSETSCPLSPHVWLSFRPRLPYHDLDRHHDRAPKDLHPERIARGLAGFMHPCWD